MPITYENTLQTINQNGGAAAPLKSPTKNTTSTGFIKEAMQNTPVQSAAQTVAAPTYNLPYSSDTDYASLMQQAIAQGDYQSAGVYEALRNSKIANEGLNYEPSSTYADYVGDVLVNYIDKNGNKQTGQTNSAMDYYNQLLSQLDTLYQSSVSSNNTQYAAQLQQLMAQINQKKAELNRTYDDANKQLYIDRRRQERTTPQALAAMGYNGGLTESSLLGIQSGYQENLLENEANRQQGLAALDTNATTGETELAIARAQAEAAANQDRYSNYAAIMAQLAQQRNYEDEVAREQENAQMATYQGLLAYLDEVGLSPTASQLSSAYGITAEDAAGLLGQRQVSNGYPVGSNPVVENYTPAVENDTPTGQDNIYTLIADLRNSGMSSDQINEILNESAKNGDITRQELLQGRNMLLIRSW